MNRILPWPHLFARENMTTALVALTLFCGTNFSDAQKVPPAANPSTQTAPASALTNSTQPAVLHDWPAFHGGGALLGVADPLPPPLKVRWTYTVDPKKDTDINGSAAIVGDTVYIADSSAKLHALNLATGKPRWAFEAPGGFKTTPLVVGDRIFIGDQVGTMLAIDRHTGTKIWSYNAPPNIESSANVAGDAIIFGTNSSRIICLTQSDGKVRWNKDAGDFIQTTPAILGNRAYIAGCDKGLRALDITTGEKIFSLDLKDPSGDSPAVLSNAILIGTHTGSFFCFGDDHEKPLWSITGVNDNGIIYASPTVSQNLVVIPMPNRRINAYNINTGKQIWSTQFRLDIDTSPVIAGNTVYFGCNNSTLYGLDLQTGAKIFEFHTAGPVASTPAIGQGVLVFADNAGTIYCLEPAPPKTPTAK